MSNSCTGAVRGHGCSGDVPCPRETPGAHHHLAAPSGPRVRTFTLRPPRGQALGDASGYPAHRQERPGRRGPGGGLRGWGRPPPCRLQLTSPKRSLRPPPASSWPRRLLLLRAPRPPSAGPRARPGSSSDPGNTNRRRLARPRARSLRLPSAPPQGRGRVAQGRRGCGAGDAAARRVRAADCGAAGAGLGPAGPADPNAVRAAAPALPGCPSPCWSRERAGRGRAGPRGQGSAPP